MNSVPIEYPLYLIGDVIQGFGRGSKELGIPTANLDPNCLQDLRLTNGIYYGFVQIVNPTKLTNNNKKKLDLPSPVYMMCSSLGYNPCYKNFTRSFEIHIFNQFSQDFYNSQLRVAICGRIRDEKNYPNLSSLIDAIHNDIKVSRIELSQDKWKSVKENENFFYLNQNLNK